MNEKIRNRLLDFPNFTKDLDNWLWEEHRPLYEILQSKDLPLKWKFEFYVALAKDYRDYQRREGAKTSE